MEWLLGIDRELLLLINGFNAPWCDEWMWNISRSWTWLFLYACMLGMVMYRYGWKRGLLIGVVIGCCVGLSDWLSSGVIKHLVCRPRPSRVEEWEGVVHLFNGYRSGLYGFVSSHAANTMSCGLLFSLVWRDWRVSLSMFLWVFMNCYSRVYLGVHYPGDIIGGLLVGSMFAIFGWLLLRRLDYRRDERSVGVWLHYVVGIVVILSLCLCLI